MPKTNSDYTDTLRKIKSLLLVSTLHEMKDELAYNTIRAYPSKLTWANRKELNIDEPSWKYVTRKMKYTPSLVFCHPEVLMNSPITSFYYRGLTGLSIKAAKDYFGSIEAFESGSGKTKLGSSKALAMAKVYNEFICAILKDAIDWTLEDGRRTIIATHGITLDGVMRNKVGKIAEERIRRLLVDWLVSKATIEVPRIRASLHSRILLSEYQLKKGITMRFGSEPDVSFLREKELLAVLEIKGGIDPAGALERYGAARKSFEHAFKISPKCKTYYLGGVFTPELDKRMKEDQHVEKFFSIIEILQNPAYRENFLTELFHHTLRLV